MRDGGGLLTTNYSVGISRGFKGLAGIIGLELSGEADFFENLSERLCVSKTTQDRATGTFMTLVVLPARERRAGREIMATSLRLT